jgi:hypothetical protein
LSKKLLALNIVLAGVAVILATWLVRDLAASRALPPPPAPRRTAPASEEAAAPEKPATQEQLPAYNVIVSKYLFNPSRTEGAPPEVAQQKPAAPLPPKPILLGVVVDGPASRAYLEDPSTKRVFGYQVGDSVAGGKLEKITDDRIQISRTDGTIEVTLRDPTKPRPPAPPQPGAPAPPGAPPAARTDTPATPPTPGRAPVPPRSLRRVPVEQKADQ